MTATVLRHPSLASAPTAVLSDLLQAAERGEVSEVVVIYTGPDQRFVSAWSKQSWSDIAAAAVYLSAIVARKLTGGE